MNGKRIGGLIAIIFGAIILIFSIYAKVCIGEMKKEMHKGSSLFSDNIVGKNINTTTHKLLHQYNITSSWGLGIGIILIVVGSYVIIFYLKKK